MDVDANVVVRKLVARIAELTLQLAIHEAAAETAATAEETAIPTQQD